VRAAGYVRVSTEEQREEGYSLAAQRRQVKAFCDAKRWELAKVYADEGLSAKDTQNRPALQALLADAKAHGFDAVVICKLDRLSRNTRQLLALVEDHFTGNGVRLVSIGEGIDPTTATGEFTLTVLAGLAQTERKQISERTKAGMGEARKQGRHIGRVGYGFRMGESGELVKVPEEQVALAQARRLVKRLGYQKAAQQIGWPVPTLWYRVAGRQRRAKAARGR